MSGINRIVVGKRGTGKSLVSVGMACDYLKRGAIVATNLDIFTHNFRDVMNDRVRIIRVPDVFEARHLRDLPIGNPTLVYDEETQQWVPGPDFDEAKNGLVLLDELAHSLNSRDFQKKNRLELIQQINLLRKQGYDTVFIAQSANMIDAQVRGSSGDEVGFCKRMDRVTVPFIGNLIGLITGKPFKFPKVHVCTFYMGDSESAAKAGRTWYQGKDYYRLYNTAQQFNHDYPHESHCVLTPWHLKGRYMETPESGFKRLLKQIVSVPLYISYYIGLRYPPLRKHFWLPEWIRDLKQHDKQLQADYVAKDSHSLET